MSDTAYWGKVMRINLTDKSATEETLSLETAKDFLGGAGLGIKILFDETKGGTDPLGPENKLVFAVGPFTGTDVPCASRMAVVGKSPLTKTIAVSLTGGISLLKCGGQVISPSSWKACQRSPFMCP